MAYHVMNIKFILLGSHHLAAIGCMYIETENPLFGVVNPRGVGVNNGFRARGSGNEAIGPIWSCTHNHTCTCLLKMHTHI